MKSIINDPIFQDLEKSIIDPNLATLSEDYAEVALDALISDSTLKEIPVIGTIISLYKATNSISNRILMNKILNFLRELHDIPKEKRFEQIEKLSTNPKYSGRVGETLFLLIEKQNSIDKPILLARAFKAYLLEKMSYETFLHLAHAIDRLDMSFLDYMKSFYGDKTPELRERELEHFFSCGLVKLEFRHVGTWGGGPPRYEKNELGNKFYDNILA